MVFLFGNSQAPSPPPKDGAKSIAAQRPGTAGTLQVLRGERERTSSAYVEAAKAERTYVQRKHAKRAAVDAKEAKSHFKEAQTHLKAGCLHAFGAIKYTPDALKQKNEDRKAALDAKKKEKEALKLRKAEEEAARKVADAEAAQESATKDDTIAE